MSRTVLVLPTDGNQQDCLLEAIQRWVKFYADDFSKVVLVGAVDKLTGVLAHSSALTRVQVDQHQRRPRLNVQRSLRELMKDPAATEYPRVIWSHDDILLTKEVTLDQLTQLTKCARRTEPHPRKAHSSHALATEATLANLRARNLPAHDYELHLPLVIEDVSFFSSLLPMDDGIQFRSHVLNQIYEAPAETISDCELFRATDKIPPHGIFSLAKNLPYQTFL